jgi:cytosine/adenosine deaminase-related metal-dependent hydrolase
MRQGAAHDLGASILVPGLVNVHTSELTAMRGFPRAPFRRWIVHLTKAREASMTPERSMPRRVSVLPRVSLLASPRLGM